ncbi:MAG: PHP domain-containing protein [Candidatus Omnitrophota bacterium]
MSKLADLHLHTNFSDGTFTPEQLVKVTKNVGLACIAITDHDCISGIEPAIREADNDLEVIPGIELTAEIDSAEIHILGYFIDHNSNSLEQELDKINLIRRKRVYGILEKLKSLGMDLKPEDVFEISGLGSVGRLHIARAMQKRGFISNIYEAFSKYIGDKGPAYVGKFSLTPQDAIKLILEVKGIPVLAHPHIYNSDELIPSFVKAGLRGIEVYYPEYSEVVIRYYAQIADKYNLLVTGGSDCHGDAKPNIAVGKISIPYELVERLKKEKYGEK